MRETDSSARAADHDARLVAQTVFDRPIVLEAGAGTGKTAALVARIVAWCLGPGWERAARGLDVGPDEIASRVLDGVVAITFTEEAAAEMARRIAEAFDRLGADHSGVPGEGASDIPGLFPVALPPDRAPVAERAGALLSALERLRVSTIHSFARTLVARFPIEAGFNPTFEIDAAEDQVAELVDAAIEELLSAAYRGPFDGRESADAMLLAGRGVGPAQLREATIAMVRAGLPAVVLNEDFLTPDRVGWVVDALRRGLDGLAPSIEALALGCSGVAKTMRALGVLRRVGDLLVERGESNPLDLLFDLRDEVGVDEHWSGAVEKLKQWARGEFLVSEAKALGSLRDETTAASGGLPRLLDWVKTLDTELFGAMQRTVARVVEKVEAQKIERGIVVFQDLLVGGRQLLEDHEHVLRAIRSEMTQLLVDEMQDTDAEQAEIVRLLVGLNTSATDCPCLFLVGDPKQSIFGWRSADMAVYQGLVREVEAAGGEVHSLTVNFRSVQPVLDEVQRLVKPVMTEEAGVQPRFEPLHAGVVDDWTDLPQGRRVIEHWLSAAAGDGETPAKTNAAEAARLAADAVARDAAGLWRAGEPLDEMAILLRSRTYQDDYLEALRERGVPYVVGKDQSFYRMREVGEVMSLVRLVLDPFDSLALAAVLRSPMVAVPDVALRPLWVAGLPGLSIELAAEADIAAAGEAIETAADEVARLDLTALSLTGLDAWPKVLLSFIEDLAALRRSFADDPPDRFLENLRSRTLVEPLAAGRFPGRYRLANLDRFFRDFEQTLAGGATAAEVLRRLRRLERERPDELSGQPRSDERGVRVLTIHGAKGLGFRYVWLVQTHAAPQGGRRDRNTADRDRDRWEVVLHGMASPGFLELERQRRRVEEAERVRLLYVALTRARLRLVTVGDWEPEHPPGGSMRQLLESRTSGWLRSADGWPDASADPHVDLCDVRWLWLGHPSLRDDVKRVDIPEAAVSPVDPQRVQTEARQIEAWQEEAIRRQARPWLERASDEGHDRIREAIAARLEGDDEAPPIGRQPGVERRVATAVGTAVHAVLERFDLGARDPDAELERLRKDAVRWLSSFLGPGPGGESGREQLDTVLDRLRSSPLWERFLALDEHIVARELGLAAKPGTGGAVGAVTGAIDLVYRDPATNQLVIADYKTDRVEGDQEIAARAAAYAGQLDTYTRAVAAALKPGDPPRSELWFLYSGRIVGSGS